MTMYDNNGNSRGGLPIGRLLIGAVIAIGALVSYFASFQRNPTTGELQAVAIDERQEIALGVASAPQMASEMGGEISAQQDRRAAHVSDLGQQLVHSSKAGTSPYGQSFNFHLLADPKTINAFALPGGQIFITDGLYELLTNDAQLAGVLGHEIGHVVHRHASNQMAKGQLGQNLVGAVATGTGYSQTATYAAQFADKMLSLKYSRGDELEADQWGLVTMQAAGYDPQQMLEVMKILKKASGGAGGSAMFSTHPDPDARMAKIKEYLDTNFPSGAPKNLTSGPAPVK